MNGLRQTETRQHRELRDHIWEALGTWRNFLVAVDGVDGAGKSTLARYLAWQLGMPAIETDTFLDPGRGGLTVREQDLLLVIQARLNRDRPVIVEGIRVLHTLRALQLQSDYLVLVQQEDHEGSHSLCEDLRSYAQEFRPQERADFVFTWRDRAPDSA